MHPAHPPRKPPSTVPTRMIRYGIGTATTIIQSWMTDPRMTAFKTGTPMSAAFLGARLENMHQEGPPQGAVPPGNTVF